MSDTRDLMTRLREDTRAQHEAAERNVYMGTLFAGRLPRPAFVEALRQQVVLYRGIESRLRAAAEQSPQVRAVLKPHHFVMAGITAADLADWGASADGLTANEGVAWLLAELDKVIATSPEAILGAFYVLEGSLNGAKIIGKKVREVFQVEGDKGVRHLDPHGPEMRARWMEFVMAMNQTPFDDATKDQMLKAATITFDGVGRMYNAAFKAATSAA